MYFGAIPCHNVKAFVLQAPRHLIAHQANAQYGHCGLGATGIALSAWRHDSG
jgi:hypothetical protein